MALTKAERLARKEGELIRCDTCGKQSVVSLTTWLMNSKKEIVCPSCQPGQRQAGGLLVSL